MDLDLGLKVQIPLFAGGAAWMIMNAAEYFDVDVSTSAIIETSS
jgi:hypothetical protein